MQRLSVAPRENWQRRMEELGFVWHSADTTYWDETACYEFSPEQVRKLETASAELYRLFVEAGQDILDRDLFRTYGYPDWVEAIVRKTWDGDAPSLHYGRFDLGYDGTGEPRLFEFNADTPTSLYEASVVQWNWKEDVFPAADQFNSIHERLIARWRELKAELPQKVYFTTVEDDAGEDIMTTTYLAETAAAAGVECWPILTSNIGWDRNRQCFTDLDENRIEALYKLYPWEWLVAEEFGRNIPKSLDTTSWIEPAYKLLWSNKRILVHLWEMFPDHPNLLPAYLTPDKLDSYAAKPCLGREGANITIVDKGHVRERTAGAYDADGGTVYQGLYHLPVTEGGYPVIGSWIIGGEPAGMGIREAGLVTGNRARFIPHIVR